MSKASNFGMWFHQRLSFSPLMMRAPKAQAVFWPGCALMNLDRAILEQTLRILRRTEPGIGFSSCCCGQPTRFLFPRRHEARQQKLRAMLQAKGIRRIYAACPNCISQLRTLSGVEVIPIWSVLAEHLQSEDLMSAPASSVTLHDPCPMRRDISSQKAVRQLLAAAKISLKEPEHAGEKTLCCGNTQMLHSRDPEASAAMRKRRVEEFDPKLPVCSYCEGCLGSFRGEKLDTLHVLELLFGRSTRRSWGNRFTFTLLGKKGKS